ncbi:MAG: hypothetical protein IJZ85_12565 [Lachnospiraceae bacterium]|nr:hypothetical protein [Lachnospiraceae bacterium]
MKLLKKSQFWYSIAFLILFFVAIYPYRHDMYIAVFHTMICVMLNGASSVLFAVILYLILCKKFMTADYGTFLWLLFMQAIGHGIFAFMNWGSWLCLGITAVILVCMAVTWIKARKNIDDME